MQGGYNTGKDIAIDINGPNGPIRISKITSFDAKPKTTGQTITPLNGQTDELLIPVGWTGTIKAERVDGVLDDFWVTFENNYFNGIQQDPASITETIQEPGGGESTYRYTNVILKLEDAGEKSGDKTISQSLSFTARRRIKV